MGERQKEKLSSHEERQVQTLVALNQWFSATEDFTLTGHLAMSADIMSVMTEGLLLASSE